jgi:hypothetical protein
VAADRQGPRAHAHASQQPDATSAALTACHNNATWQNNMQPNNTMVCDFKRSDLCNSMHTKQHRLAGLGSVPSAPLRQREAGKAMLLQRSMSQDHRGPTQKNMMKVEPAEQSSHISCNLAGVRVASEVTLVFSFQNVKAHIMYRANTASCRMLALVNAAAPPLPSAQPSTHNAPLRSYPPHSTNRRRTITQSSV